MDRYIDDRRAKVEAFKKNVRGKKISPFRMDIPEGLFVKCEQCDDTVFVEDLENSAYICPKCGYHFRLRSRKRLEMTVDTDSFEEMFQMEDSKNPLDFPDYSEKIQKYQEQAQEKEAFICGKAKMDGLEVAIGALDSYFMMGSMGTIVGEKVARLVEFATKNRLPLILFNASGGARMQEGIFSLMQMAKTATVLEAHHRAGLLYISVITHPTTGGVSASFASLGDIILAEKGALFGFAGQRVIKQTIRQELPKGFQTAEFQLTKGGIDKVVDRRNLRDILVQLLQLHKEVHYG